jgi:3-hydroxyisobutyrate dehydrogenase-like beta-hydroxyacid dehydrogenase
VFNVGIYNMTVANKVLVIGLGSMGYGIASSLIKNGHDVYGVDKDKKTY